MEEEPKDIIVLGAIKNGAKKFDKIRAKTGISPEELNQILEKLEERGFIKIDKKKGFLGGEKIELNITDKGNNELQQRIYEMEQKWNQMVQLYKLGDKKKMEEFMGSNKSDFAMMMFFGIMNMMMFSMMFSMIGASMLALRSSRPSSARCRKPNVRYRGRCGRRCRRRYGRRRRWL